MTYDDVTPWDETHGVFGNIAIRDVQRMKKLQNYLKVCVFTETVLHYRHTVNVVSTTDICNISINCLTHKAIKLKRPLTQYLIERLRYRDKRPLNQYLIERLRYRDKVSQRPTARLAKPTNLSDR
ncbi:hypothetical protein J6590_041442 [Homalodisca vitripennis]|nr:hypothetical protein J6590_041442 [Homalodisca vitripennis]